MGSGTPARRRYSMSASGGSLALRGEIDLAAADDLREHVLACASATGPRVEIDLRAVEFIDSSGLDALLTAQEQLRPSGSTIVLTHVPPLVRRTIMITRLHDHLTVE
jgi:anti-sigma B factor antagonist